MLAYINPVIYLKKTGLIAPLDSTAKNVLSLSYHLITHTLPPSQSISPLYITIRRQVICKLFRAAGKGLWFLLFAL